ncbi:MAG: glycogen synthase [Deltaproteobacteria bacterium]|nr:MAG: glycogen synthase [Deltaproteobacteria bacterium]
MRIVMAASEAVPFVKVGGLGDVAGTLPRKLAEAGHEVTLFLPRYASIDLSPYDVRVVLQPMGVPTGAGTLWCRVLGITPSEGFEVYFIEHDEILGRGGIYGDTERWSRGARFIFFSRAVLQTCIDTALRPDVIHCHDWMTAMIPAYLKSRLIDHPVLEETATLLTIHNIGAGYQGRGYVEDFLFSGLPTNMWEYFEYEGITNLLKGGILLADQITAVSPGFAREILTPEGGGGLDGVLRLRRDDLHGILNGVDYEEWNPERDPYIPANYSEREMRGKLHCKLALQEEFGLDPHPNRPLFGFVSRMDVQKGLDLIPPALPPIMAQGAQFICLGSGHPGLESAFMALPRFYPGQAGSFIGYSNEMAHRLEAGLDIFLMPSRWEPCGLNQMYSLRYGTLPLVRATGGLDDTVENYDPLRGTGTGFKFRDATVAALGGTMLWALDTWWNRPFHFRQMQLRAMQQRFTWEAAVEEYVACYRRAAARRSVWG